MRKSPCRHHVKSHVRDGYRVHSYMRGHGGKAFLPHYRPLPKGYRVISKGWQPSVVMLGGKAMSVGYESPQEPLATPHELRQYTVKFKYEDKSVDSVKTVASSPLEAMNKAYGQRFRYKTRPVEVIIKNSIGAIVGRLAAGVRKAVGRVYGGVKEAQRVYREEREKARAEEAAKLEAEAERLEKARVEEEAKLEAEAKRLEKEAAVRERIAAARKRLGGKSRDYKFWAYGRGPYTEGEKWYSGPYDTYNEALSHAAFHDIVVKRRKGWEPSETGFRRR